MYALEEALFGVEMVSVLYSEELVWDSGSISYLMPISGTLDELPSL